jgi:hypothetical protein
MLSVIPAKAGIQCSQALTNSWTPFFNGVTTFYEIIKSEYLKAISLSFQPWRLSGGWTESVRLKVEGKIPG